MKQFTQALGISLIVFAVPNGASSQQFSLLNATYFNPEPVALIEARIETTPNTDARSAASLFTGNTGSSLFAPYPQRQRSRSYSVSNVVARLVSPDTNSTQIERVRALIGMAESGAKSYDAVQLGAKIRPAKRPTRMTIQEIYNWIDATPGQQHAIGHYQFIPSTLKRVVSKLGISPYQLFTPALQDQLGDVLLAEAGLNTFRRGEMQRHTFMNNLAKIWAGLPTASGNSYYEGIAGNHASISWSYFDQEMAKIFPS